MHSDSQSPKSRARALLAQMTLDEKAGQVRQYFCFGTAAEAVGPLAAEARKMEEVFATGTLGSLLFVSKASETNALQRRHLEASRLKIPLLFGFDVIHGFRTIFPTPIAMAASFDLDLVEACQGVAAREARAVGIHWTFAPMVDICRDARWGRIVEGPGEDPFLGAAIAAAQVRGFQGSALDDQHVLAGPKHFAGYGASLGGRDYDEVNLSDYELHNVYLPPFKAAIDAGARNLMTAYMPLNGVPATASRYLLTTILRDQWGFDGFVVSDANAAINLVTHGFSANPVEAAVSALHAGLDLEMTTGTAAYAHLEQAVADGLIAESVLDQAVLRILEAKFELGLFEAPFVDEAAAEAVLATPAHRELARSAAERTAVLLRNDADLLPLGPSVRSVAVLGPLADAPRDCLGPWVFEQDLSETVTIRAGIAAMAPDGVTVDYAPGVAMPMRQHPWPFGRMHERDDRADWADFDAEAELDRAVDLARRADVAVLVLGERYDMSGEIASVSTLDLAGQQMALLEAVAGTGTPVVLLLMSGRPLDLRKANTLAGAILQIWHGGTRAGEAAGRLLWGAVSPGGKLPFSWPRHVGQVPLIYGHTRSHSPEGQSRRYWDDPSTPLYPFGFGLSYGRFSYSDLTVAPVHIGQVTGADISVTVTNTGSRAADEVVQLYVGQASGSSARPVRELKGFRRIHLAPGAQQRVSFHLDAAALSHWSDACKDWVVDRVARTVWVGGDAQASLSGTIPREA